MVITTLMTLRQRFQAAHPLTHSTPSHPGREPAIIPPPPAPDVGIGTSELRPYPKEEALLEEPGEAEGVQPQLVGSKIT